MRHAVAVVLVLVAVLVLGAATSLAFGLAAEYGGDVLQDGSAIVLALLAAGPVLLCLLGARDPVGRPRPRTSVLAVGVLVVSAVSVSAAAAYGGRVHERDLAARTTACSPQDVELLRAVDAPGTHTEPAGDADGGCSVLVSWVPDADLATARVAAGLEGGGWRLTGREGDEQLWRLGEAVLRVSASSDGKATDVRLTLPPATP